RSEVGRRLRLAGLHATARKLQAWEDDILQALNWTQVGSRRKAHIAEEEANRLREIKERESERLEVALRARQVRQRAIARKLQAWEDEILRALQRTRLDERDAAKTREAKRLEAQRVARMVEEKAKRPRLREEALRQISLMEQQEVLLMKREAAVTTQHIVLGSTLVTCGAGLDMRGIVSGFESCRLTMHNLPADTNISDVIEIFTQQGMNPDKILVLSVNPANGNHLEAEVLTSAEQGAAIAAGLDGMKIGRHPVRFEVRENHSAGAMDSDTSFSDTLTITWSAPSTSVIATYRTLRDALHKAQDMDGMSLGGRRIRAVNREWSVEITGLPANLSAGTIVEWAGTPSIQVIDWNTCDSQGILGHLQQYLAALPHSGIDWFDVAYDGETDGRVQVRVRFETWHHAEGARWLLMDKPYGPTNPLLTFSLAKPIHYMSVIPKQQYNAQKRVELDMLTEELVRIRVGGEDNKAVGALKVRVETLAAGERLDATYWHKSFLWPKGEEFLAKVLSETKVYVRGDFKTQILTLYGEIEAKEQARRMIKDEVERIARARANCGLFRSQGAGCVEGHTWRGCRNPRSHQYAVQACDTGQRGSYTSAVEGSKSPHNRCGRRHLVCIRHYLTSATETKAFPLVCMVPIPIPIIQRFIIAFSTYLDRHPQDFRYCSTPDWTMLKCPSCFAELCSSCHIEAHQDMTCEDRRIRKAQEEEMLNENWATMRGVKRCPSCQVWIEKTEGCNHMICRCGAHISAHLRGGRGCVLGPDLERHDRDLQYAVVMQREINREVGYGNVGATPPVALPLPCRATSTTPAVPLGPLAPDVEAARQRLLDNTQ
ncbi:hypothetical protein FPV67DRAFT_1469945, partial [Lyophyllum atratum]